MNIFEAIKKCLSFILFLILRIFNINPSIKKEIIIFGLPSSGKTSVLYFLKLGYLITTVSTYLVNEERFTVKLYDDDSLEDKKYELKFYEIGNECSLRLIQEYAEKADDLIYIVDSTQRSALGEAREEFIRILYEFRFVYRKCKFLILLNKQDSLGCLSVHEIITYFSLPEELLFRCKFVACSTLSGIGLNEGLCWLVNSNVFLEAANDSYEKIRKKDTRNDFETVDFDKKL